ncbi:SH3 domain-containing protein [Rhizobium glycinendophyticum]|uniref:SH3 domain-containing protein n=1 Tax=Rhizobium glycinendophyticum TaxID=2589807 RepID=UPI001FE47A99|nr:SH3 domain-containing protein [Rhizobium glycinendophyticum]
MRHKLITTLLATTLGMAFAGPTAHAQQPQVIPAPAIGGNAPLMDAYLWHVRGLPPGQRLAVYSGAGPKFRVIYALDEGTPIERLSCKDSRGGYWCRIATVDRPRISGWVDGRFLLEETGFAPPQEERNAPLEPEILIDPLEKPRRR